MFRFKKIKGFGIECELWEETKKEAELLITNIINLSEPLLRTAYASLATYEKKHITPLSKEEIFEISNDLSNCAKVLQISK